MVDRVTRIAGNQITALKNVTINEPIFQGHFPGHPILPGVLQLEAIAQVAGILIDAAGRERREGRLFHVGGVGEVAQACAPRGHPDD